MAFKGKSPKAKPFKKNMGKIGSKKSKMPSDNDGDEMMGMMGMSKAMKMPRKRK